MCLAPAALQPNSDCCATLTVEPQCRTPHSARNRQKAQHDTCHSKQRYVAGHMPCYCQKPHPDSPIHPGCPYPYSQGCKSKHCTATTRSSCSCCLQTSLLPCTWQPPATHRHEITRDKPQCTNQTAHQHGKRHDTYMMLYQSEQAAGNSLPVPITRPPCTQVQAAVKTGSCTAACLLPLD